MKTSIKLGVIMLMGIFLTACMATQPMSAPCNQFANLCGAKIKINNW